MYSGRIGMSYIYDSFSGIDDDLEDLEDLEDLMELLDHLPEPRIFRERTNPFNMYDDREFKMRFRLSKGTVRDIAEIIAPDLEPLTARSMPIDALNQLLVALSFYATGTFQQNIGNLFHIHQTTAGRILHRVTQEVARLLPKYIRMPQTPGELLETKQAFYNFGGLPGVIGCIDGCHIRIESPGGDNAETFRNPKQWFSINVQAVCDAQLRITDIVTRWPGSVDDVTMFDNCRLRAQMEGSKYPNCYLLGDASYDCRSYILTPVIHPVTPADQQFNSAHTLTRNLIERTFGKLKRRFPCLSVGLKINVENVLPLIIATAVLHNIAIEFEEDEAPTNPQVTLRTHTFNNMPIDPELPDTIKNNVSVRNAVMKNMFSNT